MKSEMGNILVVDDEPIICQLIADMLKVSGYQVFAYESGEDAFNFYQNKYNTIDLVILDRMMPVYSGVELFQHMKKVNPEIRALLLSATEEEDTEIQQAMKYGILGFIQKPISMLELSSRINSVFQNHPVQKKTEQIKAEI